MKIKYLILVIVLFVLSTLGFAKKLADLPELTKFFYITVGKDNIYISDGKAYKVRIYSKNNYKYIKLFGKKGKDPGEFINFPSRVYVKNKKILTFNNRDGRNYECKL